MGPGLACGVLAVGGEGTRERLGDRGEGEVSGDCCAGLGEGSNTTDPGGDGDMKGGLGLGSGGKGDAEGGLGLGRLSLGDGERGLGLPAKAPGLGLGLGEEVEGLRPGL